MFRIYLIFLKVDKVIMDVYLDQSTIPAASVVDRDPEIDEQIQLN